MRKKILFCATVDYHFSSFHLPFLKWFKDQNWEVHIAAAGNNYLPYVDKKYDLPIQRSPYNKKNIQAYKKLKSVIDENQYEIIHCHTPMGGVLARLAARQARNHETKVIYTAHGFHFYKGAPFLNWFVYYPIEKILSKYTNCLITINEEDYQLARNHQFKAGLIEHVHGVGVNTELFFPVAPNHKARLRKMYHYDNDTFLMFYAAEFNKNKNQQILLEALALVKEVVPNCKLILAGEGVLLEYCTQLASKLGIENLVDFIGQRNDIDSLLKISDLAVASSLREGLPVNVMEAMASGLPVVAVDNRGHRELISDNRNGFLVDNHIGQFANKIIHLAMNNDIRTAFGGESRKMMLSKYSLNKIIEENRIMYEKVMNQMEEEQWAVQ